MKTKEPFPWDVFFSELIGMAVLLFGGLSLVIFMFGVNNPVAKFLPSEGFRRVIVGFLFGSIGSLISVSPIGRVSGCHINPVISFGFWMMKKIDARRMLIYMSAQFLGGILGTLPLLFWGEMGRSLAYGATAPGAGFSLMDAFLVEIVATFTMVSLTIILIAFRNLRPFTPLVSPILYSFMSWSLSPISGLSTNPARSFGPALISGHWQGGIYFIGPFLGTILSLTAFSALARSIQGAKLYYFDSHPDRIFRREK